MNYNSNYYFDEKLHQLRPWKEAIHTFKTSEGILIAVFQGSRGLHPDIDFVVKILKPGEEERPFPPLHSFWVVDLMMKTVEYREEVIEILEYFLNRKLFLFLNFDTIPLYGKFLVDYVSQNASIKTQSKLSDNYSFESREKISVILIRHFCRN